MHLSGIVADEEAVSPVIGIILMVAVTVILATVIGTFVLGIGGQAAGDTPQVTWDMQYKMGGGDYSGNDDRVVLTHEGGDSIDTKTIVKIGGVRTDKSSKIGFAGSGFSLPITSGNQVTVEENSGNVVDSGAPVLVIYAPDRPEIRAIIGEGEVPA